MSSIEKRRQQFLDKVFNGEKTMKERRKIVQFPQFQHLHVRSQSLREEMQNAIVEELEIDVVIESIHHSPRSLNHVFFDL